MSIYRFPAIKNYNAFTNTEQLKYIEGELREAYSANYDKERQAYGMELLDVIHATETALRMEFSEQEVEELAAKVREKNAKRGYYKMYGNLHDGEAGYALENIMNKIERENDGKATA